MKKITTLLLGFAVLATFAESKFESFENGLPKYAKASRPAGVKVSADHYKLGKKSLEWNWRSGDKITFRHGIGNIRRQGGYGGSYSKASFGVWVYSEKPQRGKLKFNFQTNNRTDAYFYFPLDFKGWRRATLRYSWKPQFKGKISKKTNQITVQAMGSTGKCFIDLMVYNGIMDFREQMVPGEKKWSPAKLNSKEYPLSKNISSSELAAIKKIGKAMESISCGKKKSKSINNLEKRFKAFKVVKTQVGVKGQPLVGEPRTGTDFYTKGVGCKGLQTPKKMTALMKDIAITYTLSNSSKDKAKLANWYVLLAKHLDDQGFTASGNWWDWYPGRDLAEATFLMRDVLRKNKFLAQPAAFFDYNYETSKIFDHKNINPDMDIFHIDTRYQLNSTFMQPTMQEVSRALKAFSKYLSAEILFEGQNGFKIDGCAFHHNGQYYCYARYALNSLTESVLALSGTPYAISEEAYNRLKKVVLSMRYYSGLKEPALPLHGRHPFTPGNLIPKVFYKLAVSSPKGVDPELAAAFIRLAPSSSNAKKLKAKGFKAEKDPQGHQTFNMGAFTVHRRGNWLATAKGYSKYVWHGETYAKNNRYGRYLSNGSLNLIFGDGLKSSGMVQEGFDWNRIDGATIIYLPLNKLKAKGGTEMLRNEQRFVGGLSHFGENGLFVTQLQNEKYSPAFKAKKTFFFVDDMIVCMGSGIVNSGINSPVQTNLFQRYLSSKNTPIIVDGKKITAFPVTKKLAAGKSHWLIDTNNTGYYISKDSKVEYSRKHQKSRDEHDKKATQGDFVTAWIDHGNNPGNASYLYYVFPTSSKTEMVKFDKNPKPVKVLKKDANAHAISIPSKNIYGAVLFKAQNTNYLPLVEKVSRACLVMLTQKDKNYNLTVTDPDLDFKKVGKFKMVSKRPPLYVYLKGNWKLNKAGKNVKIKSSSNITILRIMCHDGLSNDIVLSPVK